MEDWRKFLSSARKKKEPEEEEADTPSSVVIALMKRGGLSRKEAEAMAKQQIELEEIDDLLARFSNNNPLT
jgi:hypothetical protein